MIERQQLGPKFLDVHRKDFIHFQPSGKTKRASEGGKEKRNHKNGGTIHIFALLFVLIWWYHEREGIVWISCKTEKNQAKQKKKGNEGINPKIRMKMRSIAGKEGESKEA